VDPASSCTSGTNSPLNCATCCAVRYGHVPSRAGVGTGGSAGGAAGVVGGAVLGGAVAAGVVGDEVVGLAVTLGAGLTGVAVQPTSSAAQAARQGANTVRMMTTVATTRTAPNEVSGPPHRCTVRRRGCPLWPGFTVVVNPELSCRWACRHPPTSDPALPGSQVKAWAQGHGEIGALNAVTRHGPSPAPCHHLKRTVPLSRPKWSRYSGSGWASPEGSAVLGRSRTSDLRARRRQREKADHRVLGRSHQHPRPDAFRYRHHQLRSWIGLRATHRHGGNSMTGSHFPCDPRPEPTTASPGRAQHRSSGWGGAPLGY